MVSLKLLTRNRHIEGKQCKMGTSFHWPLPDVSQGQPMFSRYISYDIRCIHLLQRSFPSSYYQYVDLPWNEPGELGSRSSDSFQGYSDQPR